MDIPKPYDYATETFDREHALRHVLKYPAFEAALTDHPDELHNYLSNSAMISDTMQESFDERQSYAFQKGLSYIYHEAALALVGCAAVISFGLYASGVSSPLAASQTWSWNILGMGAWVFIALGLVLIIRKERKASGAAETHLKKIHEFDVVITESYAAAYVANMQDHMIASVGCGKQDVFLKSKAIH